MGSIELAGVVLSSVERRLEAAAHNITNLTTPGFKARHPFLDELAVTAGRPQTQAEPQVSGGTDFAAGKLERTAKPLDFAIAGPGFFEVQSDGATLYTRNGQFHRGADGKLVTATGALVQGVNGDIIINGDNPTVLPDGTVLMANQPVAQLKIVEDADPSTLVPAGATLFAAPAESVREIADPQVMQGMLEGSNVSLPGEMLAMMSALRSAESAQRVVQVYDDLMGRALSAFGQT